MRSDSKGKIFLPARPFLSAMMLVILWKLFELARTPQDIKLAAVFLCDFVIFAYCYLVIAPRIYSLDGVISRIRFVNFMVLLSAILLHPFITDRKDMAGWDKGESWAFAHPNTAGMYALSIFLITLYKLGLNQRRGARFVDGIYCVSSLVLLALTASRTAWLSALVGTILYLYIFTFYRFISEKKDSDIRILRKILLGISIGAGAVGVFLVIKYIGFTKLDELLSGRVEFAAQVVSSVKNLSIGIGLLPPGVNLEAENEVRGAGIDGLYVNLIYTEGVVGLLLFFLAIHALAKGAHAFERAGIFFSVIIIPCLLFGLTESHFWLLASPLSAMAFAIPAACRVDLYGFTVLKFRYV